jgi:type III restriction enzyme
VLTLRNYQQECLTQLQSYLARLGQMPAGTAFYDCTNRPYNDVPQLPDLPYICIRIPTGGGKTLLACHCLGIVAREYLQQEEALCLWLVPTNAIREQTLLALKNPEHPYRQVINDTFGGNVTVMELSEALSIQRSTLEGDTCIIVTTLAALRKEDTEGRKVYEPAGALQHHFTGLPAEVESTLEKNEDGVIIYSLADVLRMWNPVVVVDEAHNARTNLSFVTLERFSPSCIIEFTATPQLEQDPEHEKFASNVIAQCSAAQLKAEQMIKLPITLETKPDWNEVLEDTVKKQSELEEVAIRERATTGEYIRPMALIQAQPRRQGQDRITAEVVKKALLEECKVPVDEVAVVTGEHHEITGIDLFDENCHIRFIITQKALAEGWDCSFAYVFCSVADVRSTREVQQLLGRILRLPRASSKENNELNRAYAIVSSHEFSETVMQLADVLVENGFEKIEANRFITPQATALPLPGPVVSVPVRRGIVPERPDLSLLDEILCERVAYDDDTQEIEIQHDWAEEEQIRLERCFRSDQARAAVREIMASVPGVGVPAGSRDSPFRIPRLGILIAGELVLFEENCFIDATWNIADCDITLTEMAFSSQVISGATGEVDVTEDGRISQRFIDDIRTRLSGLRAEAGWTKAELANWLDRNIAHPDIPRVQSSLFIHRVIERLIEDRGVTVDQLAKEKYRLRDAVADLIDQHRQEMRLQGYQDALFPQSMVTTETSPDIALAINADNYAPSKYYEGGYEFRKHAFCEKPGNLQSQGEEFECAKFLDQLPGVKRWLRNVERDSQNAFWLQTSTDKFYPDFLAELTDGRHLVVEYKGHYLWDTPDSKEKRDLGDLWAVRSNGKCLFVMPDGPDWQAILKAVQG